MPDWKAAAREKYAGKQQQLKAAPGCWIIPCKLSIQAQDKIQVLSKRMGMKLGKVPEGSEIDMSDGDLVESFRITLLGGVFDHNFEDSDGKKLAWDEALVEQIMKDADLTMEINNLIQEPNRPLSSESSVKSATPPSGSTEESPTNSAPTPSSPTAAGQRKSLLDGGAGSPTA